MRKRLIFVAICIVTLAGFFLPVVNLQLAFLGTGRSIGFGLTTPFQRSGSSGLGGEGGVGASDMFNMIDINMFSMSDSIGRRIISGSAFYFTTFLLFFAVTIFTALGKFKKATIILHLLSIGLLVASGLIFMSIPNVLFERIRSALGFMAVLINVRNMLNISLGTGYWLSMAGLVVLLLVKIAFAAAEFQVPVSSRSND